MDKIHWQKSWFQVKTDDGSSKAAVCRYGHSFVVFASPGCRHHIRNSTIDILVTIHLYYLLSFFFNDAVSSYPGRFTAVFIMKRPGTLGSKKKLISSQFGQTMEAALALVISLASDLRCSNVFCINIWSIL